MKFSWLLIFFMLILEITPIKSQNNRWNYGYIVKIQNDTVLGLVKIKKTDFYKFVSFKPDSNQKAIKYDVTEVRSYKCGDDEYISLIIPNDLDIDNRSFCKKINSGAVNLYFSQIRKITCSCNPEGTLEKVYILLKDLSDPFIIEKRLFSDRIKEKESLASFFSDNKELSEQIRNDYYRFSQMIEIVNTYNRQK
ncbi:MAG: hypothetical protein HY738_06065 [Bacteroidia bacterium]|nr:hypothetical protein [Bacteroidia bacterium]